MKRKRGARAESAKGLKRLRANVAGVDLGAREHWVFGPQRNDGTPNVQTLRSTTPELERLLRDLPEQRVVSL